MEHDEFFLSRALELAWRGRFTTSPNPNVGCVIVRDERIVGEGYHQRPGDPHAEIYALRWAGKAARGATAYVTLEPCSHYGRTSPCTDALINAGIVRVVAAMIDPNPQVAGRGFCKLEQAGIALRHGLMLPEAEAVNPGFLKRMRTGFPWVRLKLAASLDGRTAMASGESKWITSSEARCDVQRWRAESDAILSTAATVMADDPALTVRWQSLPEDVQNLYPEEQLRQPVRIIIDTANRVTPSHVVAQQKEGQTWLARLDPDDLPWPASVSQLKIPANEKTGATHIDLMVLMMQLGRRQINSLWVEAGASMAGALLSSRLVDELILYQAPKLLGSNARPLCLLPGLQKLSAAPEFTLLDIRQIGPDIRLRLKPGNSALN
ncbi:bifunctional diaminohydroxyphosphoribosylaminopyrimidine deaminase/5-amino-6-(5-phosphoribosylamino)uracil reductase RibD [Sodalis endosymbiont of Henestaris halophilus]|uniref:bifunctional diaminohydroxyphosphoribosylaminopyrimidine deaminase/5-amino-6-(5-phosphoribosylamino)uracil reductase RibD n=1 Tax=Sodalis endosymbiont of Henestaris halophilus TaxID=1929246 RepID=UPI000BC02767|nr:bifunctional diaminohydroxyphosphoribosylaminopyrimidine deaminase/5-amino-6-(5-phosphoribosylamino)uracil reductase RibD [Sodalis endosymbiont of Henestaris halophilus]SNC58514.1 Riboflavin biosynthesis protein RibD [Sodalis endosymbiont of Henestaris halophilus]